MTTYLNHHLRKYRKAACLSQSDMSFILGLSQHSSIGHWEQNRRSPDLETIVMYNTLFDVPMNEYFAEQKRQLSLQMLLRLQHLHETLTKKEPTPKVSRAIEFTNAAIKRLSEFTHEN